MKQHLDIILGLMALIGIIYRVFQIKAAIYNTIENVKDSINKSISSLEHNLAVHIAIYCERKEQVDYLLHANEEKIDHKANRLLGEIKELKAELKYKQKLDEGKECCHD